MTLLLDEHEVSACRLQITSAFDISDFALWFPRYKQKIIMNFTLAKPALADTLSPGVYG